MLPNGGILVVKMLPNGGITIFKCTALAVLNLTLPCYQLVALIIGTMGEIF